MQTQLSTGQFRERLATFIAAEITVADEPVERDTDLLLSGPVDSVGVVMISGWIREQLEIAIDPVDIVLENFQTLDAMVAHVESRAAVATP